MLPFTLAVAVLLPVMSAQAADVTQSYGGQTSSIAITGIIIGAVLFVLSLVALAVYGIERCLYRRRAKSAKFTPLPTQEETEPYQYLSLPPAMRIAKDGQSPSGSYYIGATSSPPVSPNARTSTYGDASPVRSPGARSVRFDTYGHGPFYPGNTGSSPSSPQVSQLPSPTRQSHRKDSQITLYSPSSPMNKNSTPFSFSLRDVPSRGSESRTVSRATSTTLGV
ncbi:hypothetical protein B0H11DRAFT_1989368 [Mycena galericulata]|nr:hypothetical protein B0H11DRAFT_1989368 [Mycena galericulata]